MRPPSSALVPAALILLAGCAPETEESRPTQVMLYPESGSVLWGYQNLSLHHGLAAPEPVVSSITYDMGEGPISLITADNPLRSWPGVHEITFCAECVEAASVALTVEFEAGSGYEPIHAEYGINHMPQVVVVAEVPAPGQVVLDASGSEDPEGAALDFEWGHGDSTYSGPQLTRAQQEIVDDPPLLLVTDGLAAVYDVVTLDPSTTPPTPVYTPDHLRCKNLIIREAGDSWLTPEVELGPKPPVGTKLPVNAAVELTDEYHLSYAFEIVAQVEVATATLDEGQDAAGTMSQPGSTGGKRGRIRREPDRSSYAPGEVDTPFPSPLPAAGTHPRMSEDDYDDHPLWGHAFENPGARIFQAKAKGLVRQGGRNYLIWYDQPGLTLKSGDDVRGTTIQAYFRSWLKPKLDDCQKHFIVDIAVDATGTVTKSSLTER